MFPNYLLIAYKKDSDDYCRGCHMASYGSDFEIHEIESKEDLIKYVAFYLSFEPRVNEEGYELNIYPRDIESTIFYDAKPLALKIIKDRRRIREDEEKIKQKEYQDEELERKRKLLTDLKRELGE